MLVYEYFILYYNFVSESIVINCINIDKPVKNANKLMLLYKEMFIKNFQLNEKVTVYCLKPYLARAER